MSILKQYKEEKKQCKVTFKLPEKIAFDAKKVNLTGDFNNWDIESIPMKKSKNGVYTASVDLEKGKEYQFRYILDGKTWLNDQEADHYIQNEFHTENSVVVI